MPAISSIAVILFVIAPYNARNNTQVPQQITLATNKKTKQTREYLLSQAM
jgi:hypothetical protein